MSTTSLGLSDGLLHYLRAHSLRETAELAALRAVSDDHPRSGMRSSAEQVQLLALLARLLGARRIVEVGVFTGYGTLGLALALPDDGELHGLDISAEYPAIGRPFWEQAGVANRIHLHVGPALASLAALLAARGAGSFDLAYIDADKANYPAYVDACAQLVRPGGLIAIDNVLWGGAVADPAQNDPDTAALKRLNTALVADPRFELSMVPIGDGVTLLRVR